MSQGGQRVDCSEIRLPIASLPEEQSTVTWGDGFAVTRVTRDFGLHYVARPYHGELYRLSDIPTLVARYGLQFAQADGYDGLDAGLPPHDAPEAFGEIQLWSDEPIRPYLVRP